MTSNIRLERPRALGETPLERWDRHLERGQSIQLYIIIVPLPCFLCSFYTYYPEFFVIGVYLDLDDTNLD